MSQLSADRRHEEEPFLELLLRVLSTYSATTAAHSQRVSTLSVRIASQMGLSKEECERIRQAALLHDIGKVGVPDKILYKPGSLSEEELEWLHNRMLAADYILRAAPPLADLREYICQIYEGWDGTGLPDGVAGEEIPLASRIIAVADAFDSLITDQPYRDAHSIQEARNILKEGAGIKWDPTIVDILLHLDPQPYTEPLTA